MDKHYMCKHCIDAIRSHGEKIMVSPLDYFDFDRPDTVICDFCEEELSCDDDEVYEVAW